MQLYNKFVKYTVITVSCLLVGIALQPKLSFAFEEDDLLEEEAALLAEIKQQLNNPVVEAAPVKAVEAQQPVVANTHQAEVKPEYLQNTTPVNQVKQNQAHAKQNTNVKAGLKVDIKKAVVKAAPQVEQAPKNVSESQKITDLLDENATLKSTLMAKEAQLAELQAKLSKQRNEIIITESELERVSKLVDQKRSETLEQVTGLKLKSSQPENKPEVIPANYPRQDVRRVADTPQQAEKMSADMTIATVVIDKANLRTGPGTNNSPLMAVSKGTRLAVETRQGDWYRVIAPTGMRAWVSADVVRFGKDRFSEPTRTLRVKGYNSAEEDAIELIKRSLR